MVYAQCTAHVVGPIAQMTHPTSFAIFFNDIIALGASYCLRRGLSETLGLFRHLGAGGSFFFSSEGCESIMQSFSECVQVEGRVEERKAR